MKHSQNLSTFNLLKYSIFTIFLNMNCTLDSSSNSDLFLLIFSPLYITIQFFHKIFHSTSHFSLKIRSEYQNFTHFYFFSTFFSIYFWIKLYSLIYAFKPATSQANFIFATCTKLFLDIFASYQKGLNFQKIIVCLY